MNIVINGKLTSLPTEIQTVNQLLSFLTLDPKVVIVEQNEQIVLKQTYDQSTLSEGDKIELVHFVGGG